MKRNRSLRSGGRRWGFETLEQRRPMAGNVTGSVSGGDLTLSGDSSANGIEIRGTGTAGEVEVTGFTKGGSGTTVNGTANGTPVLFSGVTSEVIVSFSILGNPNDGDDEVNVYGLNVAHHLNINTGNGTNIVRIGANPEEDNVVIALNLFITGGTGADTIYLWEVDAGATDITTGDGDDIVNANYVASTGADGWNGGNGNDSLSVAGSTFANLVFTGGDGNDTLAIDFCEMGASNNPTLDGGAGQDFLLAARSIIPTSRIFHIYGKADNDTYRIGQYADGSGGYLSGGNTGGEFRVIDDLGGDEIIYFVANWGYKTILDAGSGNDYVQILNNDMDNAGLQSTYMGSGGFDQLRFSGNTGWWTSVDTWEFLF